METLDKLLVMVEGHVAGYKKLSEVLNLERKALLSMDLNDIQKKSKAKEAQVHLLQQEVGPLSDMILEAARELGLPGEPRPLLVELAEAAGSPLGERLGRNALTLARIKRDVLSQNEANKRFIKESLNMIGGAISILTGAPKPEKRGYLASGQRAGAASARPVRLNREI